MNTNQLAIMAASFTEAGERLGVKVADFGDAVAALGMAIVTPVLMWVLLKYLWSCVDPGNSPSSKELFGGVKMPLLIGALLASHRIWIPEILGLLSTIISDVALGLGL